MENGDREFIARVRRRARNVEVNAGILVTRVASSLHRQLVYNTPVDTGRARSNWQLSVGVPVLTVREPYSPGEHLGIGERANAAGAIADADLKLAGFTSGSAVHITNNVHYIGVLNEGHSPQALPGFIESALLTGIQGSGFSLLSEPIGAH